MFISRSTKDFSFNKDTNTLFTNASDLELPPGIWPDEIRLTSHKSGRHVTFYKGQVEATIDDVLSVEYSTEANSNVTTRLIIFND